jgi:hypothetical protein
MFHFDRADKGKALLHCTEDSDIFRLYCTVPCTVHCTDSSQKYYTYCTALLYSRKPKAYSAVEYMAYSTNISDVNSRFKANPSTTKVPRGGTGMIPVQDSNTRIKPALTLGSGGGSVSVTTARRF